MKQTPFKTELHIRRKDYVYDNINRFWMAGKPVPTHFLNTLHLMFPPGEYFFVQVIKPFMDGIKDPKVKAEARDFMTQEIQHAMQHEKYLANFRAMGYKIDGFLNALNFMIKHLPGTQKFKLSLVAGLEHFTALFSHIALKAGVMTEADPQMRELFEWHAAEEIEHKAVAFDVLQSVSRSYFLRIAGIISATTVLSFFIFAGTLMFTIQDRELFKFRTLLDSWEVSFGKYMLIPKAFKELAKYFAPGFHPGNMNDYYLAEEVFKRQAKEVIA